MTKEETIVFLESIKRGLYQTGKDYPYRDVLIPKMKEALCVAIKKLKAESCEDCVSRKAIIKTLNEMDRYIADELVLCENGNKFPLNEVFIVDDVYEELEKLPSVRPARKTGKWIKAYTEEKYISLRDKITVSTYMCSECGRMINNIGAGPFASRIEGYPYCHCGAKMIGVEK